jgi:hypothetical protein
MTFILSDIIKTFTFTRVAEQIRNSLWTLTSSVRKKCKQTCVHDTFIHIGTGPELWWHWHYIPTLIHFVVSYISCFKRLLKLLKRWLVNNFYFVAIAENRNFSLQNTKNQDLFFNLCLQSTWSKEHVFL